MTTSERVAQRHRIRRTLTFWLRPGFALRVVNRFQRVAGFDRSIALASSALTALIPLSILWGLIVPGSDGQDVARQIITRYGLTGGGAQAVRDALAPASGTNTSIGVVGAVLLVVATLSFSRGMQRMFEQIWELKPLSVRNTVNDLVWILGVVAFFAASWGIHGLLGEGRAEVAANLVAIPISALFLAWSGRTLSASRIAWRALIPFAVLGAIAIAICLSLAGLYVPHLFSSYASRYGVIGAVLAMTSALFVLMVVIVGCAAAGREVSAELDRIRRGLRPPDDEVQQEWNAVIAEARLRSKTFRDRLHRLRHRGQ